MTEASDHELLAQLVAGDQRAFEALFSRHYQRVYRAAYGLAQRHDAADDLAQEAFLALLRRPPALAEGASLAAWLCRVALNRGMNMLRSARREEARALRLGPGATIDPDDELLRDEQRQAVRRALARLDDRQARLLALRYSGLSYSEVAEAVGVAASSVGTLLARAERAFLAAYTALEPHPQPAA